MPAFEGGAPIPVTTGGSGPTEGRRAAVPVYVVSGAGAAVGQKARRVVVVTDGPVEGGAAHPVYDAGVNAAYSADEALPVYVVSGSLGSATATPSPLLNGLVASWKLDTTAWLDSTGRGNTLAGSGSPTTTTGKIGNAAQLTLSSAQDLHIADNADLSMGDIDFTIDLWAWLDTTAAAGQGRTMLAKYNYSSNQREYLIDVEGDSGNKPIFTVSPDGTATTVVMAASGLGTGAWNHILAWHDSVANTINIRVNGGTVVSAAHSTGVFNGTSSFFLGSLKGVVDTWGYDGRIDNVNVWKRVLTDAEQIALYNGGSGSTYPFDDTHIPFQTQTLFEDFSGSSLNSALWTSGAYWNNNGAGGANADELQAVVSSALTVSSGSLHITTADVSGAPVSGKNYTSGTLTTDDKFEQLYGRFTARMKFPAVAGLHSTFWLMPADDTWPPEIDIAEQKGGEPTKNYMSLHYVSGGNQFNSTSYTGADFTADYHEYRLDWLPGLLIWYVDDVERKRLSTNVPSAAMFVVFNVSVGDAFAGATIGALPAETLVDWLKVWAY